MPKTLVLPSDGFNEFHTTTINNNGEPNVNDMMIVAEKVGLNKNRAKEIIEEVNTLGGKNRITNLLGSSS